MIQQQLMIWRKNDPQNNKIINGESNDNNNHDHDYYYYWVMLYNNYYDNYC